MFTHKKIKNHSQQNHCILSLRCTLQMCCLPLQSRVCSDHASLISLFCIIQILSSFDMNYSFKREITSILVVSSKFEICQSMPHNCYSLCLLSFLCFLYHSTRENILLFHNYQRCSRLSPLK